MTYSVHGINVVIPDQALRPRESPPPLPAVTMSAPLVSQRFLRPRSGGLSGVQSRAPVRRKLSPKEETLLRLKAMFDRKKQLEKEIAVLKRRLVSVSRQNKPQAVRALQAALDSLVKQVMKIAGQMNQLALAAIKLGATEAEVRAIVGKLPEGVVVPPPPAALTPAPVVSPAPSPTSPPPADAAPPPAAAPPVVETNEPKVREDGALIPGPDAKVLDPTTGKEVAPESGEDEGYAAGKASAGGIGLAHLAVAGGLVWWFFLRKKS